MDGRVRSGDLNDRCGSAILQLARIARMIPLSLSARARLEIAVAIFTPIPGVRSSRIRDERCTSFLVSSRDSSRIAFARIGQL